MARRDPVREGLARLAALRVNPRSAEARAELKAALGSKSNLVVARAAGLAADAGLHELAPYLASAFDRLMTDPVRADRTCAGKIAVVAALAQLGERAGEVYIRAVRHFQMEPAAVEPIDTAAELRAVAAVALVECQYPKALDEVLPLLLDREPRARIGGIRALVAASSEAAALVLRFKALAGDEEMEVLSECLGGLLTVQPDSLPFVASFLDDPRVPLAALTALTIGESRLPEAFTYLRAAWDHRTELEFRKTAVSAFAFLRDEEGFGFLLDVVQNAAVSLASEAVEVLASYVRGDAEVARIARAAGESGNPVVKAAFEAWFPRPAPGQDGRR